jgi:hypothetical protein
MTEANSNLNMETLVQGPVMQVFAISNGFILVIAPVQTSPLGMVTPYPDVIYAKDEVGIAEEIIAAQARHKLDVEPKQGEMFGESEMGKKNVQTAQSHLNDSMEYTLNNLRKGNAENG